VVYKEQRMIRARFPVLVKIVAAAVFIFVAWQLAIHLIGKFNRVRPNRQSNLQLQNQLVADFNGFKYVHHEGGRTRYILTAAKDRVFGDGHHDLSVVKLEIYDKAGLLSGQVTSDLCRYDQAKAVVRFEKNVLVDTADGLKVKTEILDYNQQAERVETEELVEFVRGRAHGSCRGLLLDSPAQRLEMKSQVHVIVDPETAGSEKADSGKKVTAAAPTSALSGKNVGSVPVEITGNWAEYTGKDRVIRLRGAARIAEPERSLTANAITAFLTPTNQVERVEAREKSLLESKRTDMPAKVEAEDMDFFFDAAGNLTRGEARGNALAETLSEGPERQVAADRLELFAVPGASGNELQHIKAIGSVNLKLSAPPAGAAVRNPASKEVTAAEADLYYQPGGRFLREAEARGRVVVTVTPSSPAPGAERRTLRAEYCKLMFFDTANAARELIAEGGVKIEAAPYEPADSEKKRAVRTTESDHAKAYFDRASGQIATMVQEGNFKYDEGTRHAVSERANYDAAEARIELRGGKVAVWDETARTQADEIDLLTAKQESFARGRVRSTYYNPGSTGQAAPFRNMQSPVFITSKEAHSLNARGEAIYTGDARSWQDDNFVRAERLELYRDTKRMVAIGNVSSVLYQARRVTRGEGGNGSSTVPVFATSSEMTYSDQERLAEYSGAVKMRQGEEKLEAERVKIFLAGESNEVERMEAIERVLLVQPGRQAEGDRAEYTALDERTVIMGNMARVVSQTQGSVMGRRLTLMGGDDKIFVDDQRGAKRVKSTHEVRR
jgi:LPS export ABC transporter protein LptC/lipopolysaccharide transport protein LptA